MRVESVMDALRLPLDEALRMGSLYPAAFIGEDNRLGRIAPGYQADLVLFRGEVEVVQTWIAGEVPET